MHKFVFMFVFMFVFALALVRLCCCGFMLCVVNIVYCTTRDMFVRTFRFTFEQVFKLPVDGSCGPPYCCGMTVVR